MRTVCVCTWAQSKLHNTYSVLAGQDPSPQSRWRGNPALRRSISSVSTQWRFFTAQPGTAEIDLVKVLPRCGLSGHPVLSLRKRILLQRAISASLTEKCVVPRFDCTTAYRVRQKRNLDVRRERRKTHELCKSPTRETIYNHNTRL